MASAEIAEKGEKKMSLIECKNLCMKYEGVSAFENVSFSVDDGDFLCIVGENGSGKSTLVKAILGLKQPSEGEIIFNGLKQREIGYLPQQTPAQKDFPATVREVVISGCLNRNGGSPLYTKESKERASHMMQLMKIENIAKKSYRGLSGGQQQRVLLSRAMCATEKLLLLDEPVSGLDPMVTAEMYEAFDRLNHVQGVTIIMVSHDIHNAVHYGNKILHMARGWYFSGTTEEYMQTDTFHTMAGGCFHHDK